jgi:hypothetical protein
MCFGACGDFVWHLLVGGSDADDIEAIPTQAVESASRVGVESLGTRLDNLARGERGFRGLGPRHFGFGVFGFRVQGLGSSKRWERFQRLWVWTFQVLQGQAVWDQQCGGIALAPGQQYLGLP